MSSNITTHHYKLISIQLNMVVYVAANHVLSDEYVSRIFKAQASKSNVFEAESVVDKTYYQEIITRAQWIYQFTTTGTIK